MYPASGTSQHETAYGVGTDPNWYPYITTAGNRWDNKNDKHSGQWNHPPAEITTYHIDMLFDADHGTLQFCVVECPNLTVKLWGIPIKTLHGFV
eukprot:CAMPEP_0202715624 /NCGR_PEP_ID=MMETSP1385-20130828/92290_1 /ASSEMBLY_ACC=CAM_ASM_000861 /TAXON_ID=933848 /ORGANISM="Elphidium margaritaceum" /LENGTH=93 /DNA_ID=CAMNT_0049376975 /DNA_START=93 /DNA_END=371 /DNA_ORIENTATION=+